MDTLIAICLIVRTGIKTEGDLRTKTAKALATSQSIPFQVFKLCLWGLFLILNWKLFGAWISLQMNLLQLHMAWDMFLANQWWHDGLLSIRSYLNGFTDGMGAGIGLCVVFLVVRRSR
jgi:hypothetical protein